MHAESCPSSSYGSRQPDALSALPACLLQVYSIREAATKNLQRLAQEFGADWAKDHIVPQVLGMINNPHYLYRMTVLIAVAMLAPVVGSDTVCNSMLPVVVGAVPCLSSCRSPKLFSGSLQ